MGLNITIISPTQQRVRMLEYNQSQSIICILGKNSTKRWKTCFFNSNVHGGWLHIETNIKPFLCTFLTYKITSRLAGHWKIEFWIHHKKDGFFLHNLFILGQKVRKSHVVLTDHCQIYGLPLTSHVISAKNWEAHIWVKITWDVNGSP